MSKIGMCRLLALFMPLLLLLTNAVSVEKQRHTNQNVLQKPADLAQGNHIRKTRGDVIFRTDRTPIDAQKIPPQVGLDHYSIKPEQDFGFFGSGFPPNEWVEVRMGNLDGVRPLLRFSTLLARSRTNAGGNLAGRVTVPLLPSGDYPLYFVDRQNQVPVIANLNIQGFTPWVTLDNYSPPSHYLMGFKGEDFAPGEPVLVYLNQQNKEPIAHLEADTNGGFNVKRAWDLAGLTGENTLIFVGAYTGITSTARFTILPSSPTPHSSTSHSSGRLSVQRSPTLIEGRLTNPGIVRNTSGFNGALSSLVAPRDRFLPINVSTINTSRVVFGAFVLDPFAIGLTLLVAWFLLSLILGVTIAIRRPFRYRTQRYTSAGPTVATQHRGRTRTRLQDPLPSTMAATLSAASPTQHVSLQTACFCPWCGLQNISPFNHCARCKRKLPQVVASPDTADQRRSWIKNSPPESSLPQPRNQPARQGVEEHASPPPLSAVPGLPCQEEDSRAAGGQEPTTIDMQFSSKSDRGCRRANKVNEDTFLAVTGTRRAHGQVQPFGLFVVADGMGGYTNGQEASRMTVQMIFQYLVPILTHEDLPGGDLSPLLEAAVQRANKVLYRQNQRDDARMGCTVTAALVAGQEAHICNVGDSRTYLLTPQSQLRRVTVDHSIVESLVVAGIIQRDDVYTHPRRNKIYRSLGQNQWVQIDTFRQHVTSGDHLLLCSDGLWEMIRDPDIEMLLRQYQDPTQASGKLIERANLNGGWDNITVIVVKMIDGINCAKRPGVKTIESDPANLPYRGFVRFLTKSRQCET
jgi:serine/threonine protein phosphatase PrpC